MLNFAKTRLFVGMVLLFAFLALNLKAKASVSVCELLQTEINQPNHESPLTEIIHKFEEKLGITVLYDQTLVAGLTTKLLGTENQILLEQELQRNNLRLEKVKDNNFVVVPDPNSGKGKTGKKGDSRLQGDAAGSNANSGLAKNQIPVKGKVTDLKGEPLIGVTILEKGTSKGTITDFDGNFSFSVSGPDVILVISYIGYIPQEIPVGTQTDFSIKLTEDVKLTNEVVVVGYGTQNKRDLTGAVGSVTMKEITSQPVPDIGQAVQGRVAGIQTVSTGAPGSNVTFRIRGTGTINSADPLIVIDGIPTDLGLNAINPDDVASFDILKDASASAIYGSRGANGVVLITTKKGKAGESKISFTTFTGVQQATNVPQMLNASQFAH